MLVRQKPLHIRPTPATWQAIFLGASRKLSLDPNHTILCHLASRAATRYSVPWAEAYRFVKERIAERAAVLALEFGFERAHADVVRDRVFALLQTLDFAKSNDAVWPSPIEWLAIDRAAAAQIYLDGRKTLSQNLAEVFAARTGMSVVAAKKHVHRRIADACAGMARECGFGLVTTIALNFRLSHWLDSFDR